MENFARGVWIAAAIVVATPGARAQQHDHAMAAPPGACAVAALDCADKATPAFAADNSLWLAWSANGRVAVQRSTDLGQTFSSPLFVNTRPEKLDAGADSRPQVAVDRTGRVSVAYTVAIGADFAGQVLIARSADGRRPFETSQPLTGDTASQRFIALAVDPSGDIFAAWIDKRNLAAAKRSGTAYDGAALAFARAEPGKPFAVTRIAQDNTCECCRIGVAFAGPRRPVIMWRNMFAGGVRDHAVMTFADGNPGPVYRVAVDDWKIDACPHHGPSLAVGANGTYHASWFTEGRARQGVFYAKSSDGGRTFSPPMAVGDSDRQPSRPVVFAAPGVVWLAWKEFDGEESIISVMHSRDDGGSWSAPVKVASSKDASDHPLLIGNGGATYLSWLTRQEGYRLIALKGAP